MFFCRAVDAAAPQGRRATPAALVSSASMTVLLCRAVDAATAVGGRAAKFAFLLVSSVFVLFMRAMDATGAIGAGVAVTAFAHGEFHKSQQNGLPHGRLFGLLED